MQNIQRWLRRYTLWLYAEDFFVFLFDWSRKHWTALVVCALLWLSFGFSTAHALEGGVIHNTYNSGRLDPEIPGIHVKVGQAYYVWASYEKPNVRLVGQRMGDVEFYGFGGGLQHAVGDFRPFIEFGWFDPSADTDAGIRNEAVVTELNNNHGWRGNRHFDTTEYNVSSAHGGRVGVLWDVRPHLAVGLSYRFLKFDEQLQAYTGDCDWPPTKACKSWWVENRKLDVSAVQVGVYGRF